MGSVQNPIICNVCGFEEAVEDFYYKTGEVYVFCPRCGYSKDVYLKSDGKGNLIVEDGELQWQITEIKAKGVIIVQSERCSEYISIPFDESRQKAFRKALIEIQKEKPTLKIIVKPYNY